MNEVQKAAFALKLEKAKQRNSHEELSIGYLRYEMIRKLNPHDFAELHRRNLAGERFDDMIDELVSGVET